MILGNLLKEVISNLPVIIVEKNILKNLIDNWVLENTKNILNGKFLANDNLDLHKYKFKIIPFSSLGNQNGLLLGFKPDNIKVYSDGEIIEKEAIIGIYEDSLSGRTNDYNAIIGL